jgi:hypothetical protein
VGNISQYESGERCGPWASCLSDLACFFGNRVKHKNISSLFGALHQNYVAGVHLDLITRYKVYVLGKQLILQLKWNLEIFISCY